MEITFFFVSSFAQVVDHESHFFSIYQDGKLVLMMLLAEAQNQVMTSPPWKQTIVFLLILFPLFVLVYFMSPVSHPFRTCGDGCVWSLACECQAAKGEKVRYGEFEANSFVRIASSFESCDQSSLMGHVSEFRLWSTVRTGADIAAMMNQLRSPKSVLYSVQSPRRQENVTDMRRPSLVLE